MESLGGAQTRPVIVFGVDLSREDASSVQEPPRNLQEHRFLFSDEPMQEQHDSVSTELTLSHDPWRIKKVLTKSDLGHLGRLLLPTALFREHILGYLLEDDINSKEGLSVGVFDTETKTWHELCLKRWPSVNNYVLIDGWRRDFVIRRELEENDKIGLFWNPYDSKFHFCVLSRAAKPLQNSN